MKDDITELARAAGVHPLAYSEEYLPGLERLVALVRAAERERVMDEWFMRMQADLEHGVKWLNENAAETWRNNYPQMAGFADAVVERSKA